ncbi:PfkB family carbohydrate kinase [Paenibacillus melissococcoides]|uniref:PfkB family carbohydrate kinase n=1 Tax=Paenibacillus melissococcoides TaxID=2912268 RepID=A0ABM9GBR6_9BACL|nr:MULTISPECIES: PfkB family carbohydrate kinase [Paenibacillus]MEB9892932.1 PfkB family carbohydrate kinase [Bacillus cereus]GIO78939.1 sugar kinase [Paenibacillus dendritiformis]CAH8249102.1 PfkB family carbohydrate kinase [Paenibacillus melissococcoides]
MSDRIARLKNTPSDAKVLVLGAAVIDVIIQLDSLPRTGDDVSAEHRETLVGGCAYNVAHILKQLQVGHDLFVPVGAGAYADMIRKQLLADSYPLLIEEDSGDNGWNLSIVEQDGERTFITIPGIETKWKPAWFEQHSLEPYDYIYLSGYELEGPSGSVILDALGARQASCRIIFDPSPRVAYLDRETLRRVLGMNTILHLNRAELSGLTGKQELHDAVQEAYRQTGQPVVVTLGQDGTLLCTSEGSEILPARQVTVVDTIGAGDSHTGAFIAGLASGWPLGEACLLGNDIAGQVVQQQGGRWSL